MSDYKEWAYNYDQQVHEYDSYGFDVLFGMGFEYVKKGEKLLDIGIGTGLASHPYAKCGLKVYGVDTSQDMIKACRSKDFAEELKACDVTKEPLPYPDRFFDHVISCGVFHFFGDLSGIFAEVNRVLQSGGIFGFTTSPLESGDGFAKEPTAWGVPIYMQAPGYIQGLFEANGMEQLKEQRLLTKGADKTAHNMEFAAIIARKL